MRGENPSPLPGIEPSPSNTGGQFTWSERAGSTPLNYCLLHKLHTMVQPTCGLALPLWAIVCWLYPTELLSAGSTLLNYCLPALPHWTIVCQLFPAELLSAGSTPLNYWLPALSHRTTGCCTNCIPWSSQLVVWLYPSELLSAGSTPLNYIVCRFYPTELLSAGSTPLNYCLLALPHWTTGCRLYPTELVAAAQTAYHGPANLWSGSTPLNYCLLALPHWTIHNIVCRLYPTELLSAGSSLLNYCLLALPHRTTGCCTNCIPWSSQLVGPGLWRRGGCRFSVPGSPASSHPSATCLLKSQAVHFCLLKNTNNKNNTHKLKSYTSHIEICILYKLWNIYNI